MAPGELFDNNGRLREFETEDRVIGKRFVEGHRMAEILLCQCAVLIGVFAVQLIDNLLSG
jgi:hypothetical protein